MHPVDWNALFIPAESLLELMLRGSAMYLFVFAALRFFRRESGSLGTADLLLLVLVADAAQNAMASEYTSLTEGLVLVGTILGWNFLLDWLASRFPWAHKVIHGDPLLLVEEGRVLRRNLRREFLTLDDLKEQLRQHEVEDVSEVRRCFLEPGGQLSVLKFEEGGGPGGPGPRPKRVV